ncbi:MAG: ribosome maturation factor RimM [Luteibaculaceae bacterium]
MQKIDCFYLGKIVKPHGYKGGVSIFLDVDDASPYKGLDAVFTEVNGKLSPLLIKTVKINQKNQAIVQFDGVDTEEDAKFLSGRPLYLPLAALPKLKGNQFYYHEIVDFKVQDKNHGAIGTVVQVIDNAINPLIEGVFEGKNYLFPIIDQVILNVDRANQTLHIEMPPGLLELYMADPKSHNQAEDE